MNRFLMAALICFSLGIAVLCLASCVPDDDEWVDTLSEEARVRFGDTRPPKAPQPRPTCYSNEEPPDLVACECFTPPGPCPQCEILGDDGFWYFRNGPCMIVPCCGRLSRPDAGSCGGLLEPCCGGGICGGILTCTTTGICSLDDI